ncbi:MAG: hypothetical protein AAFW84_00380 [Cyanobacteria bacterium J06635_15]
MSQKLPWSLGKQFHECFVEGGVLAKGNVFAESYFNRGYVLLEGNVTGALPAIAQHRIGQNTAQ